MDQRNKFRGRSKSALHLSAVRDAPMTSVAGSVPSRLAVAGFRMALLNWRVEVCRGRFDLGKHEWMHLQCPQLSDFDSKRLGIGELIREERKACRNREVGHRQVNVGGVW